MADDPAKLFEDGKITFAQFLSLIRGGAGGGVTTAASAGSRGNSNGRHQTRSESRKIDRQVTIRTNGGQHG